jgi:hypothetical protein
MYKKSISALFCHKNMKESPPKVEFPLKKKVVDFLWQPLLKRPIASRNSNFINYLRPLFQYFLGTGNQKIMKSIC